MLVDFIIASIIAIVWLTALFIMSNKIQYYKKLYHNERLSHNNTKDLFNARFERPDGWDTSNDLPRKPYNGKLN